MTPVTSAAPVASRAASRRTFIQKTAVALASTALPAINFAQSASTVERQFSPIPGAWRTFEVTTRVDIAKPQGGTRLWLPIPSINSDWQKSLESSYQTNGTAVALAQGGVRP